MDSTRVQLAVGLRARRAAEPSRGVRGFKPGGAVGYGGSAPRASRALLLLRARGRGWVCCFSVRARVHSKSTCLRVQFENTYHILQTSYYILLFLCIYICIYVYMYKCIYIYINTYTHIHTTLPEEDKLQNPLKAASSTLGLSKIKRGNLVEIL